MPLLVLRNARLALEGSVQSGGVLVRDGRIGQVFRGNQTPAGLGASESIDLGGAYLAPGLIDIHIHGSAGVDAQATDVDGLTKLSEFLISEGVTGYFATLVPTNERGYSEAIATINSYVERQNEPLTTNKSRRGARILGIHFEGPFVNQQRCGALRPSYFRTYDGDPRSIELFAGGQSGIARLMTLAPEAEHGLDLIRALTTAGARAFVGHSQADPMTLDAAAEAGARHITHFPNALDPLHHRKPGAVAWGLVQRDVTLDCIADFHHVDPLMLRLIYQSKGADRMALISDAIMPAGLGDGEFRVWDDKVVVLNGRTALAREHGKGTIAGSVITLRQAVKNIIDIGVPMDEAVGMASLVPARASGIQSEHGSIEEGKRADLIAFDREFVVRFAALGGAVVFSRFE